jgi:uncharacterized protein
VRAFGPRPASSTRAYSRCRRLPEVLGAPTKFEHYYDFEEAIAAIPSHRFLAVRRGEAGGRAAPQGRPRARGPDAAARGAHEADGQGLALARASSTRRSADGLVRLLAPSIETDLRIELKMPPTATRSRSSRKTSARSCSPRRSAAKAVLGIDPGQRTGCKCVVLDATGKLLDHTVTSTRARATGAAEPARRELLAFVRKHGPVGDRRRQRHPRPRDRGASRARCSPRPASPTSCRTRQRGRRERVLGLGRRPRGVPRARPDRARGHQHRAPPARPARRAGEDRPEGHRRRPVPARRLSAAARAQARPGGRELRQPVGVELNTASAPLLAHVAGIGPTLARRIVAHRKVHGPFTFAQRRFST